MTDLARLEEALRNAHKAGDTQAAKQIATAIRSQSSDAEKAETPEPVQEPEKEAPSLLTKARHVLGGIPQAAFDIADTPYNMSNLYESLSVETGKPGWVEENVPEFVRNVFSAASNAHPLSGLRSRQFSELPGVKSLKDLLAKETVTSEEAPIADAIRTGLEWGAAGPVNAVRNAGIKAGLSTLPKASYRPDVLAGFGAAIGDYLAKDVDPNNTTGELIGGLAGVGASIKGKRAPGINKAQDKALKRIDGSLEDVDKAKANIQAALLRNEKGSMADLSRDRGAFNLESGASVDSVFKHSLDDKISARNQQIAQDAIAPFGSGEAALARQTAKDMTAARRAQVKRGADQRLSKATARSDAAAARNEDAYRASQQRSDYELGRSEYADQAAERANEAVRTDVTRAQASRAAQGKFKAADDAFELSEVKPAWKKFDEGPPVDMRDVRADIKDDFKALPKSYKRLVKKKYGNVVPGKKEWGELADPKGVSGHVQTLKKAINANMNKQPDIADIIVDDAVKKMEKTLTTENPAYRNAVAKTKEKYDRFRPGKVGKARKKEPEVFIRSMGLGDEGGEVTAQTVLKSEIPGIRDDLVGYLKAEAASSASGTVDDAFMRKYRNTLQQLDPKARAQFEMAADSNLASKATADTYDKANRAEIGVREKLNREKVALPESLAKERAAIKGKQKKLDAAVGKTQTAKYAEDPDGTLNSYIKQTKNAGDLKKLNNAMKARGAGDEFRGEVRNWINKNLFEGSDTGLKVKPKARGDFDKIRGNLTDADILTKAEADDIASSLERTSTGKMRMESWQEMTQKFGSEWNDLISSGAGALGLKFLPGSSLILAGAVRRAAKRIVTSISPKPRELQELEKFLLNPEDYLKAAESAKTSKEAAKIVLTRIVGATQAADILAEEEQSNATQ